MIYPNAPIREAVYDIRVDKLKITDAKDLLKINDALSSQFPEVQTKHSFVGKINLATNVDQKFEGETTSDLVGYVYMSGDRTRQLQVSVDGFTMNILKPYHSWEEHFDAFMYYWSLYNKEFEPSQILRISTRFINRIELPMPISAFQDYINNMPPIPSCLPQTFNGFIMQTQVPSPDFLRNVILTETIEQAQTSILPFILDIDVVQELSLENTIENLTLNFNQIRKIKNDVFECCITDKTRQLFQ